jgi:hypothetical protein
VSVIGAYAFSNHDWGIWQGLDMNIEAGGRQFDVIAPQQSLQENWLLTLPSRAWAWELLRRNPDYVATFDKHCAQEAAASESAGRWGLLKLEDPAKSSLEADAFWRNDVSRDVLPLVAQPLTAEATVSTMDLTKLRCRAVQFGNSDGTREFLFSENGRALQVSVTGDTPIEEALLLTPALPALRYGSGRLLAVKRFADLAKTSTLRSSLYPAEKSAKRLSDVLAALDGWRQGLPHREIATQIFGSAQVSRAWNDSGNHLRDRVRRAIRYGRDLMEGGYRNFLK